jgi:hypothetical protein
LRLGAVGGALLRGLLAWGVLLGALPATLLVGLVTRGVALFLGGRTGAGATPEVGVVPGFARPRWDRERGDEAIGLAGPHHVVGAEVERLEVSGDEDLALLELVGGSGASPDVDSRQSCREGSADGDGE